MRREEIRVAGLAEPISHYTDAVRAGDLLFVSGLVAVDTDGNLVGGDDVVAQARQVFDNLRQTLAAAGCSFGDVVKVTLFLTDVSDRSRINGRFALSRKSRPAVPPRCTPTGSAFGKSCSISLRTRSNTTGSAAASR